MPSPEVDAIALGAVHGLTWIFPVSYDGHLALAQLFFGSGADAVWEVPWLVGSLAATLLVLRTQVARAASEGLRGLVHPSLVFDTPGGQDAVLVLVASLPAGLAAFLFAEPAARWSTSPTMIGVGLMLSTAAIGSTGWLRRGMENAPTVRGALLVGFAHGAGALPGVSYTAMTLAALLWLGVRARRAFELTFLVAIPTSIGKLAFTTYAGQRLADAPLWLLGAGAAFVASALALYVLHRALLGGKLLLFAVYLLPVAVAMLAWGYARPPSPRFSASSSFKSASHRPAL